MKAASADGWRASLGGLRSQPIHHATATFLRPNRRGTQHGAFGVKQRLLAIGVLAGSALLAVSGIRLSRTFATLGELGRVWQMPVTERSSKAVASQSGAAEAPSSDLTNPLADFPAPAPDVEPPVLPADTATGLASPEVSTAESPIASDPDDYELRTALKSALVDDLEFFELLDHSDPEIRADVLKFLDEGPSP